MSLHIIENAEENKDGQLIWEKKIPGPEGTTKTHDVNVTALLSPGKRTTGDVDILVHEAKQDNVDNPAFPANQETLNEAAKEIIEDLGLEPAWKGHEPEPHP